MSALVSVVETDLYVARASRLLTEDQRNEVVDTIAADPDGGVVVPGTGGLRKLRIALRGRGKRGGGRVIYWFHSLGYPAVLMLVYAKNEASDMTPEQRKRLTELSITFVAHYGNKGGRP